MADLTDAQRATLTTLAQGDLSYQQRGGRLMTRLPSGVTRTTLRALEKRGYAGSVYGRLPFLAEWWITEAGRAALQGRDGDG